jgi:hypothetical protein
MRRELEEAREAGERVLIFSHIAPGKFERFYQQMAEVDYPGFHWLADAFNEKYLGRQREFYSYFQRKGCLDGFFLCTLIKKKTKFPHMSGNPEGSGCKVVYD